MIDLRVARAGVIVSFLAIAACTGEGSEAYESATVSPEEMAAATASGAPAASGYNRAAQSAGVQPDVYARAARTYGIEPKEMLAAELIVCRANGDCPDGMTQKSASDTICAMTGDC